jgi:hypothetical protein
MLINRDAREMENDDDFAVAMEPEESQRETRAKQGKAKGRAASGRRVSKISTRSAPTGKTRTAKRSTTRPRGAGGPRKARSTQAKPKTSKRSDVPQGGAQGAHRPIIE